MTDREPMTHRGIVSHRRAGTREVAARLATVALLLLFVGLVVSGIPRHVIAQGAGAPGEATPVMTDSMAKAIESGAAPSAGTSSPKAEVTPMDDLPPVAQSAAPPPSEPARPAVEGTPGRFLAEVLDSTYFIEPAEFFALDLPVHSRGGGATAVHMLGDVNVVGGRHDIVVRLFRSADYQNWLKRRGGRQAGPVWSSPRQRNVHLDQELPQGTPLVLLLDNGYSLRTPKRVRVQVQLQYQGEPGAVNISAQPAPAPPQEGDITPRSNNDEEFPPPPPPPPSSDGK